MRPQVANDHISFLVERSMHDRLPMAIFGAPKSRCTSPGALTGVIDIDDSFRKCVVLVQVEYAREVHEEVVP
jgi:hypothetical protein